MDQDDDVERLFSWLQTPDIRYREFAGAREVTDAVATSQLRTNTPQLDPPAPHNVQLDEEYPQDQFPDQSQVRVEVEPAPPPIVPPPPPEPVRREPPMVVPTAEPAPPSAEGGPFTLGAGGRGAARQAEAAEPPVVPAPPPPPAPPPQTVDEQEPPARSLDSVFNRLSSGSSRASDPRERIKHIPGLGPTSGRSR